MMQRLTWSPMHTSMMPPGFHRLGMAALAGDWAKASRPAQELRLLQGRLSRGRRRLLQQGREGQNLPGILLQQAKGIVLRVCRGKLQLQPRSRAQGTQQVLLQ